MQKKKWKTVLGLRKLLTFSICMIGLFAFFSVHVPRVPKFLPSQHESSFPKLTVEQNLGQVYAPPHVPKPPFSPLKLIGASASSFYKKLWKSPSNRDFVPCIRPTDSYTPPAESQGYLLVNTNGGLNQMRAGICDMVAVARIINATLVIPELDKGSFWQDSSNFSDVFDQDHFISALANDVKVIEMLPTELLAVPRAVKYFRSWSGLDYYENEIASMWIDYQVIRAAKSDSRLANNNLPLDIQKLRCRACYEALRFSPRIEAMGKVKTRLWT